MHDLARIAALKSNSIWPFSWGNQAIYRAAVAAAVKTFGNDPEIAGLYLRHSMGKTGWTPGLSDIDLTMILRSDLSEEQEFRFLQSFWTRYSRLHRVFPMLGEIDMLDEEQYATWAYYFQHTPTVPMQRILAGNDGVNKIHIPASPHWKARAIKYALYFYLERFLPLLHVPDGFLARLDRSRAAKKVCGLAAFVSGLPTRDYQQHETGKLFANVLGSLQEACQSVEKGSRSSGPSSGSAIVPKEDVVLSVYRSSSGRTFVVLSDALSEGEVAAAWAEWGKRKDTGAADTVILMRRSFDFWVRGSGPSLVRSFEQGGEIIHGRNPLEYCRIPVAEDFRAAVFDQLPNALFAPRRKEIAAPTEKHPPEQMRKGFLRHLQVLLLQERSVDAEGWFHLPAICEETYTDLLAEIDGAKSAEEVHRCHLLLARRILANAKIATSA